MVVFIQKVQFVIFKSPDLKKKNPNNYTELEIFSLRLGDLKNKSHFLKESHL